MTDDLAHLHPTTAALVCAVHDHDVAAVHTMLTTLPPDQLYGIVVLLAALTPEDRTIRQMLADGGIERTREGVPVNAADWSTEELRDAHAAWTRKIRTPWTDAGEREYQARRYLRRKARKNGTEGVDTCSECGQDTSRRKSRTTTEEGKAA